MVDNKLAFLDAELNLQENGTIKIKVYKKPTHTDQYLNFDSNHHISQKLGIVSTLQHRIDTIVTEDDDRIEEKKCVETALRECNYPSF